MIFRLQLPDRRLILNQKEFFCHYFAVSYDPRHSRGILLSIKSIRRFDGSCKITTWLCAIAKNLFAAYRRKHPQTEPWDDALILTSSTEEEALSNTLCLEILRGMHLLNEEMREVMYLRALGGLSFREIGEILDRTENWARVTYYRGKEKLKKELEPNG